MDSKKHRCHSGVGLAGIQELFEKLDTGLRRYDKQSRHSCIFLAGIQKRTILDAGLRRHDEQWGHSGVGLAGHGAL